MAREKISKPRRNRTVSAMTPSQLAHKRAKDRKSQRDARRRTKEYIGRLEYELEELKHSQHSSGIVQDLLRHNEALSNEIRRLSGAAKVITTELPPWALEDGSYIDGRSLRPHGKPSTSCPVIYDASPYAAGFRTYELSSHLMAYQHEEQLCIPMLESCETWVSMTRNPSASSSAAIVPLSLARGSTITNRSNNMTDVMLQHSGMFDATKLVDQADMELGLLLAEQHVDVKGWSYDTSQECRGPGSYLPGVPMQPSSAIDMRMHGAQTRHIFPIYYAV